MWELLGTILKIITLVLRNGSMFNHNLWSNSMVIESVASQNHTHQYKWAKANKGKLGCASVRGQVDRSCPKEAFCHHCCGTLVDDLACIMNMPLVSSQSHMDIALRSIENCCKGRCVSVSRDKSEIVLSTKKKKKEKWNYSISLSIKIVRHYS